MRDAVVVEHRALTVVGGVKVAFLVHVGERVSDARRLVERLHSPELYLLHLEERRAEALAEVELWTQERQFLNVFAYAEGSASSSVGFGGGSGYLGRGSAESTGLSCTTRSA